MGHPLPRVSQTCGRRRPPPGAAAAARPRLRRSPYGRCAPAPGPAAAGPGVPWRRSAVSPHSGISWAAALRRGSVLAYASIRCRCQPSGTTVPAASDVTNMTPGQSCAARSGNVRNALVHFYMFDHDAGHMPCAVTIRNTLRRPQCFCTLPCLHRRMKRSGRKDVTKIRTT